MQWNGIAHMVTVCLRHDRISVSDDDMRCLNVRLDQTRRSDIMKAAISAFLKSLLTISTCALPAT